MDNIHIIMYYIWKYSCATFQKNTEWVDVDEIYKMATVIEDEFNKQTEHNYITEYLNKIYSL
jgi:hypothetical protein